jgi:hypothetical protein
MGDQIRLQKTTCGSFQPSNVRTGTLRLIAADKARPIVAALIVSNLVRTSGSSRRWPCRSMPPTRIGISGCSRFPHIRPDASQITISA